MSAEVCASRCPSHCCSLFTVCSRPHTGNVQVHRDKRAKSGAFVLNPMDEALTRKCDTLVKALIKRSQGVHFSKPVEWRKMGLLEYPKLIKEPMDLSTVSDKVSKGLYQRLEHFVNDVRLVWVSMMNTVSRLCHEHS